jgi:hypothetical protein
MADEEGFVRRWSRRKSAARGQGRAVEGEPAQVPEPEGADAAPAPAARGSAPPAEAPGPRDPEPALDLDSLPDIESLTYESDYTGFMRKGVPAELRKRALERLWRSDPVLANLDGLLEYGEDYTKIGTVKSVVRTAYQVGRGMFHDPADQGTRDEGDAHAPAARAPGAAPAESPAAEADAGEETAAGDDPTSPTHPGSERG